MALRTCWVTLCLALLPQVAHAFAEDVCPAKGGWKECAKLPCDVNQRSEGCKLKVMFATGVSIKMDDVGARSTVHFDSVYLLAQAVGFSPRDAYQVASYDEAVDTGYFILRGENGDLPVDPDQCAAPRAPMACSFYSRDIRGTNRVDFAGGGVFFHFMIPPANAAHRNGLAPQVDDAGSEPFLNHLRNWVYGRGPLCVAGLTDASGKRCFKSAMRTPPLLVGTMPFVSSFFIDSVDWRADIVEQNVAADPRTGTTAPASRMGDYIDAPILPLARLGIYVHALADRISHHRCIDLSQLSGPRGEDAHTLLLNPLAETLYTAGAAFQSLHGVFELLRNLNPVSKPDFLATFDKKECDQPSHAYRHSLETGVSQASLNPADRTTEPALRFTYDALRDFAQDKGFSNVPAADVVSRDALVAALVTALETPEPSARIRALTALARKNGWLPLPLHGGLSLADWQQQSGAQFFASAPAAK